jgi:ammonia channel protein AmtB
MSSFSSVRLTTDSFHQGFLWFSAKMHCYHRNVKLGFSYAAKIFILLYAAVSVLLIISIFWQNVYFQEVFLKHLLYVLYVYIPTALFFVDGGEFCFHQFSDVL